MTISLASTEDYHLNRVRDLYADGRLNTTQLERALEHVLRGGYLDDNLEFKAPIMDRVRRLRAQHNCPHNGELIDVSDFNGSHYLCAICGMDSAPWFRHLTNIRPNRHTPKRRRNRDPDNGSWTLARPPALRASHHQTGKWNLPVFFMPKHTLTPADRFPALQNFSHGCRLSTTLRGLGTRHQQERARLRPIVNGGLATCCLCGQPIVPGMPWDLDHTPDRRGYRGVAHARCNRQDGARRGNAKRGLRRSRVW